jgi:hypothetical protein
VNSDRFSLRRARTALQNELETINKTETLVLDIEALRASVFDRRAAIQRDIRWIDATLKELPE